MRLDNPVLNKTTVAEEATGNEQNNICRSVTLN